MVPLAGPLAGAVLYANGDVHAHMQAADVRDASVALVIAALRLCPEQVPGGDGHVSDAVPEHAFQRYPQRDDGVTDGGAA